VHQPIDFDQLFAKLDNIAATRDSFLREIAPPSFSPSQQPARSPRRSPEPDASKAYQIRCSRELADDGGHPPVALELLDAIYLHHAQYVEEVGPWLAGNPVSSADDLGVYSRPLARCGSSGSASSATTCPGILRNWRPRRTLRDHLEDVGAPAAGTQHDERDRPGL
jgi:hypothetical protein